MRFILLSDQRHLHGYIFCAVTMPHAQKGLMFGLMLCYHCLEILNKFCTRSPTFLFCTELHKLCTQSCPSYFLFAKNCMDDVNSLFGGVVQRADGKRRLKLWFRCNYFICFRNLPQPCPHTLTPH